MVVAPGAHFHSRAHAESLLDCFFPRALGPDPVKRWLVILLILLALVLLLSPGIIGQLAERSIDSNLSYVEQENPDLRIESERFDRGWFSSEGRHRVSIRPGAITELMGGDVDPADGESITLVIDTHFDHGLVPVTSLGREEGTLRPGLASTVSTLKMERGDGEVVDLPGTVYSFMELDGGSTFHFLMDSGEQLAGNTLTSWNGADLTVQSSADRRQVSMRGTVLPLSIESYGVTTRIGDVDIDLDQERGRYRFGIGSLALNVNSFSVESSGTQDSGFSRLELVTDSELDGNRVSGSGRLELDGLFLQDIGDVDVSSAFVLGDVDVESLVAITAAIRNENVNTLGNNMPSLEGQLHQFAARGGSLAINSLDVELPQGGWHSSLSVEWPESDESEVFSLPSFLLRLEAEATVRLSRTLYDDIVQQFPDAAYLLATGMLQPMGDDLTMAASFSGGLLKVNGAPMPIPLGGPE